MNLRRVGFPYVFAITIGAALTLAFAGCEAASTTKATGVASVKSTATAALPVVAHDTTAPSTSTPPGTSAPPSTVAPATTSGDAGPSPAAVVDAYFAAINSQNYQEAWALGGDNLGASYSQFADGFANTETDEVEILSANGDSVNVNFTSTQTNGTVQQFTGTYTVSGHVITGASISQVGGAPVESLCGAPPNPYGYNLCGTGSRITDPPADICSYFPCIENFGNSSGYMVECNDGMYSTAGGYSEACSDHDGVKQPVYNGH
jgi:hypothetical protein